MCPSGGWGGLACDVGGKVAEQAADGTLSGVAHAVTTAIAWVAAWMATWWLGLPSFTSDTSYDLQSWVLPITAAVAVGSVMWQGLQMIVSRRPEPIFQIVRTLWSTVLWGAVGVAGTHMVLRASDGFSLWVLQQSMGQVTEQGLTDRFAALLIPARVMPDGAVTLIGALVLIASFVQALLMFFREASLVILAGLLQLAASGGGSQMTSGWRQKVLSWSLALATYKAVAALIYSVAFLLIGPSDDNDPRSFFMGVTVLALALLAMPLLVRLFSWTTGSLQSGGGGGLGLLATAGAGGIHATASLRGAGERGINDYARYLESSLEPASSGAASPRMPTFQDPAGSRGAPAAPSPAADAPPGGAAAGAGGASAAAAIAQQTAAAARAAAERAGRAMTDPPDETR